MNNQKKFIPPSQSQSSQAQSSVFSDYARYYDLLYRDKDYVAEAEYVAGLIHKFHSSTRNILELGSGTGIHASLLAEEGFTVPGIERSPEIKKKVEQELDFIDLKTQQRRIKEQLDANIQNVLAHGGYIMSKADQELIISALT